MLSLYSGNEPFAAFSKKFFAKQKKYGSRDRKQINHLCYCYFRMGKAFTGLPVRDKLLTGLFLCSQQPGEMLEALQPEWNSMTGLPLTDKLEQLGSRNELNRVFPWQDQLSTGIDPEKFATSFFEQPLVFLRIRPGKRETVLSKLERAGIPFETRGEDSLALPAGSRLDDVLDMNADAVVQDQSSREVGLLPDPAYWRKQGNRDLIRVWDCCAASGGKSILLADRLGPLQLTVSDIRESVLANLRKRLAAAGIPVYQSFAADLANGKPVDFFRNRKGEDYFDLIIADVPCSGSGTWGRTPEQLYQFDITQVNTYSGLQKKIAANALQYLHADGAFLYITCSVFRRENEEVVEYLARKFNLRIIKMELIRGYHRQSDTLFAALLQRSVD